MKAEYFRTLFDYSYWAHDRLLAAAAGMSEAEYARPNGLVYGSIRGILTRCLDGEYGWRCRLDGEIDDGIIREEQVATPEAIAGRWRAEESKMRAYLAGLPNSPVAGFVTWKRSKGGEARRQLWQILTHVVNHSTQHRREAAEALTMVGCSPGDLDFIVYLRERSSA